MSDELSPCPFCGGAAKVFYIPRTVVEAKAPGCPEEGSISGFSWWRMPAAQVAACSSCGASGEVATDHAEFREAFPRLGEALHKFSPEGKAIQARTKARAIKNWNSRTPTICHRALATQPEPGAVPELPEYVTYASGPDHYRIDFVGGASVVMALADMDRVVEARECILAARERARRAGS